MIQEWHLSSSVFPALASFFISFKRHSNEKVFETKNPSHGNIVNNYYFVFIFFNCKKYERENEVLLLKRINLSDKLLLV